MPSRKIPKNYRNITGKLSSEKSKKPIGFESKLERDFYSLFEFDNTVVYIKEQPITITYEYAGKTRTYTPDVSLEMQYGMKRIIGEIKYYDDLKENFEELRPKFEAAIAYCKKTKSKFKLFTDRCPRIRNRDYLENIQFLLAYKHLPIKDYVLLKSIFVPGMNVSEILQKVKPDQTGRMEFINSLWAMVRRRVLATDLNRRLTLETRFDMLYEYNERLWQSQTLGLYEGGYPGVD